MTTGRYNTDTGFAGTAAPPVSPPGPAVTHRDRKRMIMNAVSTARAEAQQSYIAKRRVTLVGGAGNTLLAVGKIISGGLGQSQALVVDGVHSLSDLTSDALVMWAVRIGALEADHNHPYGHERFETAATLAVGTILLLIAGGFAWDAINRLLNPHLLGNPGWLALSAAVISVAAKEGLYHYTRRVADHYNSGLIRANAWHHRSDALSSVIVIVAVIGSMAGAPWLDALAALLVALMVGWMGASLGWNAGRELVDTGLEPRQLRTISKLIDSVDGVREHGDLRTRKMGGATLADVRIRVAPDISVSEGHRIGDAVLEKVRDNLEHVSDVFVHVDPEPDEQAERSASLPLRSEIEAAVREAWSPLLGNLLHHCELQLHYRDGRVDIDLILPAATTMAPTGKQLREAARRIEYAGQVRILHPVE